MNLLISRNKFLHKGGQAMIELAFMLISLFVILFAVMEFSQLYNQAQAVSWLSREVAHNIYRECGSLEGTRLHDCVQGVTSEVGFYERKRVLPDPQNRLTLIGSAYFIPLPPGSKGRREPPEIGSNPDGKENLTRFNVASVSSLVGSSNFRLVAVGEAIYDYQPLTPLTQLLEVVGFPTEIYEATVN